MKYPLHPLCELFPKMTENEFAELCESIRANGLREKIILFDDKILEGRHRQDACDITGTKPVFEKFKGDEKAALEFVMDKNFRRRHLDTGQRAMIALEYSNRKNADVSISKAAKKMNVSRQTVHTAMKIKKASKSLAGKVKAGTMTLNAAVKKVNSKKSGKSIELPEIKKKWEIPVQTARDYSGSYTSGPAPAKETRTLGQICYDAFIGDFGEGEAWEALPPKHRKAWTAAANAVKGKV